MHARQLPCYHFDYVDATHHLVGLRDGSWNLLPVSAAFRASVDDLHTIRRC